VNKPTEKACAKEINIDPHNYRGEDPCDLDNTSCVLVWPNHCTTATEFEERNQGKWQHKS
jgi:hypothetical protein